MISFCIVVAVLMEVVLCGPLMTRSDIEAINIQKNYEKGGFFEGDMRFARDMSARNGLLDEWTRWPNNIVYYSISSQFSVKDRDVILNGLNQIQSKTCIKFVPRKQESNYVYVQAENTGCWSYVGMISGMQLLNLQLVGCVYSGTVMHEFLHALGFHHQHSATNRDDYVQIILDNVQDEYKYAFNKYPSSMITDFGVGYDYRSIMHYHQYAFSKNGQRTIVTMDPNMQNIIGNGSVLSDKDIAKIKAMYKCK